jgi:hypothetical protein
MASVLDLWYPGDVKGTIDFRNPGGVSEIAQSGPFPYSCLFRGTKWLLGYARSYDHCTNGPIEKLFLRHLEHLSTPQPLYRPDDTAEGREAIEKPQSFGSTGVLSPPLLKILRKKEHYHQEL